MPYTKGQKGKHSNKPLGEQERLEDLFAQIKEGRGQKDDEVPEAEEKEEKETPDGSVQGEGKKGPDKETLDVTVKPVQHQERVKRSRQSTSREGEGQKEGVN